MATRLTNEIKILYDLGRSDNSDDDSDEEEEDEEEVIMESKSSSRESEDLGKFISKLEENGDSNIRKMTVIMLSVMKELRNPPASTNAIGMDSDIISLPADRFISVTKFIQHATMTLLTKIPPAERNYIQGAFSTPNFEIYQSWHSRFSASPNLMNPPTMRNIEASSSICKSKRIIGRMILVIGVLNEILESMKCGNIGDKPSSSSILGKSFSNDHDKFSNDDDKFSRDFRSIVDQVMHFVNHGDVREEKPLRQQPLVPKPPPPPEVPAEAAAAIAEIPNIQAEKPPVKRKRAPSDPNKPKGKRSQKRDSEFVQKQHQLEENLQKKKKKADDEDEDALDRVFGS
jgi:hypothetical protein